MANLLQRIMRPTADEPAPPPAETGAPGEDGAAGPAEPVTATVEPPTEVAPAAEPPPAPSWRVRGRLRRRLRYLRAAREVALRDLGGLVFDLHRFERERPDLVKAKLESLGQLDRERRELEAVLGDPRETDVLRVPGLASCPRCGEL